MPLIQPEADRVAGLGDVRHGVGDRGEDHLDLQVGRAGPQASQWQHGYALAKQTGLKSGTLYPILIRLADRGLVEACWQDEPTPGRPRRHLYRLTSAGLASATGALASAAERAAEQARLAAAAAGLSAVCAARSR